MISARHVQQLIRMEPNLLNCPDPRDIAVIHAFPIAIREDKPENTRSVEESQRIEGAPKDVFHKCAIAS